MVKRMAAAAMWVIVASLFYVLCLRRSFDAEMQIFVKVIPYTTYSFSYILYPYCLDQLIYHLKMTPMLSERSRFKSAYT